MSVSGIQLLLSKKSLTQSLIIFYQRDMAFYANFHTVVLILRLIVDSSRSSRVNQLMFDVAKVKNVICPPPPIL